MMRGFLSGVFWGSAAAALGLGAVSQLTPLPVARIAADASTVQRAKPAPVLPATTPEKPIEAPPDAMPDLDAGAVDPAVKPDTAPTMPPASAAEQLDPPAGSEFAKPLPDLDPVLPKAETTPPAFTADVTPMTPPASDVASVTDAPSMAPETGLAAPEPLVVPADAESAAVAPAVDPGQRIALADPDQPAAPQADAPPAPTPDPPAAEKPEPDASEVPPVKPLVDAPIVPDAGAAPSLQLVPDAVLVPETAPASGVAVGNGGTLTPTPGLAGAVDGVTIGRLPRIGDPALPADDPENASVAPGGLGVGADPALAPEFAIDGEGEVPPLQKYARAFENAESKPLFSIILIDTGGADLDRATLAALPFPVTFALDPLATDVALASKIYRDAGQEVIMVATGIPAGATASDLEVTFQAHASALPEAIAVMDTEFGSFQADRPLATQVVPILKSQGRGLISWDRGLNVADQVARREGLAATLVFRKLDGKGENKAAVRRALDRAAFKAAQDGRVTVIGQTIPETVTALLEWALDARAASVALAPVSAVLTTQ